MTGLLSIQLSIAPDIIRHRASCETHFQFRQRRRMVMCLSIGIPPLT
jgi:hypothetical protein